MKLHGEVVPTSPFKTLYKCAVDGTEFTMIDNNIDIEFYIYKSDDMDELSKYIVETQEVHCINGKNMLDLYSMFKPKQKELFEELAYEERYVGWDDDDFLYDLIEDVQQVVNLGYESWIKRVVNILRSDETKNT